MKTILPYKGKEYKVRMQYIKYPIPVNTNIMDKKSPLMTAETECAILDKDSDKVVGRGLAKCSLSDRYLKEKGRALAFRRALVNMGMNKQERTEMFEKVYFA